MILSDHNVVLVYRNVLLISVAETSTFSSCHLSGCDVCFGSKAVVHQPIRSMSGFGGKADPQPPRNPPKLQSANDPKQTSLGQEKFGTHLIEVVISIFRTGLADLVHSKLDQRLRPRYQRAAPLKYRTCH